MRSRPPLPQMMQVASVPLGLVSMQAPLISRSSRSAKLLFFQKAAAVVVIVDSRVFKAMRNGGRGHMHETNWIFEQMPPPHFCLEVVCKKVGCVFGNLRYRTILHELDYICGSPRYKLFCRIFQSHCHIWRAALLNSLQGWDSYAHCRCISHSCKWAIPSMKVLYSSSNMVMHLNLLQNNFLHHIATYEPCLNSWTRPSLVPCSWKYSRVCTCMLIEVLEEANGNHLSFPTYLWLLSCYDSYQLPWWCCFGDGMSKLKWISLHWHVFFGRGVIFAVEWDPWQLRSCCVHGTRHCYNSHPAKTVTILQVPAPFLGLLTENVWCSNRTVICGSLLLSMPGLVQAIPLPLAILICMPLMSACITTILPTWQKSPLRESLV